MPDAPTRLDDQRFPERPPHEYPEDAPWPAYPAGDPFGFEHLDRVSKTKTVWFGKWSTTNGRWFFTFCDQFGGDTELFGVGDSPRAAFDSLVSRHKLLNGGVASELLNQYLPNMEMVLDRNDLTLPVGS